MSIIRVNKSERYTVIANQPLTDSRLSWEARGLLAYLLSKPDGWQVNTKHLVKQAPAGRDKVLRILAELTTAGYLHRHRQRHADGRLGAIVTEVYESPGDNPHRQPETVPPQPDYPDTARPDTARPDTARPDTARPDTAKPDVYISTDPDQVLIQANTDQSNHQPPPPNPQTADGRLAGGGGGPTIDPIDIEAGQDEQPQQDDPELAELADICQEIDGIDRPTAERLAAAARRHYAHPAEAVGNLVDYVLAGGRLIRNPAGMLVKLVQSGQTRLPPANGQQATDQQLRQQIPAHLLDIVRR